MTFSINKDCTRIDTSHLSLEPKTEQGREYLACYYMAVINGTAKTDNVDIYSLATDKKVQKLEQVNKVAMVTAEEYETFKGNTIVDTHIPNYVDDVAEDVFELDEKQRLFEELNEMEQYIEIEKGVNIIILLKRALEGNANAKNILRKVIEEFALDNIIKEVLRITEWYGQYIELYGKDKWWFKY